MGSKSSRSSACVQTLGSSLVDLFVLKLNSKLTTYISPIFEPEAWKVNSLVQSWAGLYAYAYPATNIIRQILTLNRQDRINPDSTVVAETAVVPRTTQNYNRLPIGAPSNTQVVKADIHQPVSPDTRIPQSSRWRLSGDSIKLEDFRNKCLITSPFLKDNLQLCSTKTNGNSLESGVCLKELIQTRLLSP